MQARKPAGGITKKTRNQKPLVKLSERTKAKDRAIVEEITEQLNEKSQVSALYSSYEKPKTNGKKKKTNDGNTREMNLNENAELDDTDMAQLLQLSFRS